MIGAVTGRSFVAGVETILEPQRHRIDAELCCDHIHLRFAGPDSLGNTEAAKRATAQFVCIDQGRSHPKVGNLVRSDAVFERAIAAGKSLGVGAGVPDKLHGARRDRAVALDAGLDADGCRHRARGGGEFFCSAVDQAYWPAGLERKSRGIGLEPHGVFAAETGADLAPDDANLLFRQIE